MPPRVGVHGTGILAVEQGSKSAEPEARRRDGSALTSVIAGSGGATLPPLEVEWGRGPDGLVVSVAAAEEGVQYVCPSCAVPLVLKAGSVRRKHFAHKVGERACSAETVLHKVAKARICQAVADWQAGRGLAPVVLRRCEFCGNERGQALPKVVAGAAEEVRLPGGRILDVAFRDGAGQVVAGLEVFVTHEVTPEKSGDLGRLPWAEVRADQVLAEPRWPLRQDGFRKPCVCEACRDLRRTARARVAELLDARGLAFPRPPYRVALRECWKCGRETVVFAWPGRDRWPRRRPPGRIPVTVKFKRTEVVKEGYWANTCQWCRRVQGDFHLHLSYETEGCGCERCVTYRLINDVPGRFRPEMDGASRAKGRRALA